MNDKQAAQTAEFNKNNINIKINRSGEFINLSQANNAAYSAKNIDRIEFSSVDIVDGKKRKRKVFKTVQYKNGVQKSSLLCCVKFGGKQWHGVPVDVREDLVKAKIFKKEELA